MVSRRRVSPGDREGGLLTGAESLAEEPGFQIGLSASTFAGVEALVESAVLVPRHPTSRQGLTIDTTAKGMENMTHYFDSDDRAYTAVYKQQTPDILKAFNDFDRAVFAPEGREIPLKYRELIAVGVALTTQCAYCIDTHSNNAVKAGASKAELAEAAWVAATLHAGASFAHGRLAFKLTDHEH